MEVTLSVCIHLVTSCVLLTCTLTHQSTRLWSSVFFFLKYGCWQADCSQLCQWGQLRIKGYCSWYYEMSSGCCCIWDDSIFFFFFKESKQVHVGAEGRVEGEEETLKQAPCPAWNPTPGSWPWPWDHDLGQNQESSNWATQVLSFLATLFSVPLVVELSPYHKW